MSNTVQSFVIPSEFALDSDIRKKIEKFLKVFPTFEDNNGVKLLIQFDKRSNAYYLNCHLDSKPLATKTDLDAILDPEESEDYKINRGIYLDTYAYRLMESDALLGRSFEDLVVEYDTSYRPDKPLKVFGGQHRIMAIREAVKKNVQAVHGVRVYFGLTIDQKVNIAMANNTSIAVSNDLLDRMQEELLGTDLRNWCQTVGLLDQAQNFADKRSPEGIPTVRIARTILVNFYHGKKSKDDDFHLPVVCSSGPGVDEHYKKIRDEIDWSDKNLKTMGQKFAILHKFQRERVLSRDKDTYLEFANKAMHPCVAAAWAYSSGFLQRNPEALKNHYSIVEISPPQDPLNATALLNARLKGVDPDTYRGLGARINNVELGRMLEVFLLQAIKATKREITQKLANAAIQSYEAKKRHRDAERALKGI
ncbi:MAG: hypothetical protein ACFFCW_42765 [Candidatus Hodarchaeota archaeon]